MTGNRAQRRILIVDDEKNVALFLKEGLEELCVCEIDIATNGGEAMQFLERGAVDLLITDYKMPGDDGMVLAARVQQLYPRMAIIMITAYGNSALRDQATRAGIRCILDKPVRLAEIRCAVLEVFRD